MCALHRVGEDYIYEIIVYFEHNIPLPPSLPPPFSVSSPLLVVPSARFGHPHALARGLVHGLDQPALRGLLFSRYGAHVPLRSPHQLHHPVHRLRHLFVLDLPTHTHVPAGKETKE